MPLAPSRIFLAAIIALALIAGCSRTDTDMSTLQLAPPGSATPYAEDDASTDRVSLAFADLHATMRGIADGRWEPKYYRLAPNTEWSTLLKHLEQQATDAGWRHDDRIGEAGPGYRRRAWRDGSHAVAAALVEPPAGSDGATVLLVLSPARR